MKVEVCSKEMLKAIFWASLDKKGVFDKFTERENKALAKQANDDKYGLNIALDYAQIIMQKYLDEVYNK